MSCNAQADWFRFQKVAEGYCSRLVLDFPEDSRKEWIVRCYLSFKHFIFVFHDPHCRDRIISLLDRTSIAVKAAVEYYFNLSDFPIERLKNDWIARCYRSLKKIISHIFDSHWESRVANFLEKIKRTVKTAFK
jgi:hypothetical protein